jgi:uncharacterized protein (UPF0332 family)
LDTGYPDFAASRAYYAMFYVAQAFLEGEGLAYSKHSAVIAAFGQRFTRTNVLPVELHRYLIEAQAARHAGDYGELHSVTPDSAQEQVLRAGEFLAVAEGVIGLLPPEGDE